MISKHTALNGLKPIDMQIYILTTIFTKRIFIKTLLFVIFLGSKMFFIKFAYYKHIIFML